MNIALWTAQIILAVTFLASGIAKSTMSKERMISTGQTGVAPFPLPFIRVVAACELLAVLGLILPQALGVAPILTPLAATGLAGIGVPRGLDVLLRTHLRRRRREAAAPRRPGGRDGRRARELGGRHRQPPRQ